MSSLSLTDHVDASLRFIAKLDEVARDAERKSSNVIITSNYNKSRKKNSSCKIVVSSTSGGIVMATILEVNPKLPTVSLRVTMGDRLIKTIEYRKKMTVVLGDDSPRPVIDQIVRHVPEAEKLRELFTLS